MVIKKSSGTALFLSAVLVFTVIPALPQNNISQPVSCDFYILQGGAVLHVTSSGVTPLKLKPDVRAIFKTEKGLYYIRYDDSGYAAGFYSADGSVNYEYQVLHQGDRVARFAVHENVFYILMVKPGIPDRGGELLRFNPDQGKVDTIGSVWDFGIAGGQVFIIRGREIVYNNAVIPLMLEGVIYVKAVVDERLVLVTNGGETEVCDIVSGRNLYQYGAGTDCPGGDGFNLVMEFVDSESAAGSAGSEGAMTYYNIFINGNEDSRTETAPGRVRKTSFIRLEPGKVYLVRAERWELDRTKGKYVRVNNIRQPGEIRIFIPENRGVSIEVEFNGREYRVKHGIYRGCGKTEGGR